MKVQVIQCSVEELEAKLREWHSQHGRARIAGTAQSAVSHNGQVLVILTMWYQE